MSATSPTVDLAAKLAALESAEEPLYYPLDVSNPPRASHDKSVWVWYEGRWTPFRKQGLILDPAVHPYWAPHSAEPPPRPRELPASP